MKYRIKEVKNSVYNASKFYPQHRMLFIWFNFYKQGSGHLIYFVNIKDARSYLKSIIAANENGPSIIHDVHEEGEK